MDSFERYQGDTFISNDNNGQAGASSDHLQEILTKSKARLNQKRNRESNINEIKSSSLRKDPKSLVNKDKRARVSTPIEQQRLEETSEQKKARKLALKLARNEKRVANQLDSSTRTRIDEGHVTGSSTSNLLSSVDSADENKDETLERSLDVSKTEDMNPSVRDQLFSTEINSRKRFGSGSQVASRRSADDVEEDLEAADIIAPSTQKIILHDAVEKWNIDKNLEDRLSLCGIADFFPIQTAVIPVLLRQNAKECIRKRDICVAAPTGSGKTLSYAIPIVQSLLSCQNTQLRAIVILPSRELVTQVYKVFCDIIVGSNIKVGVATGQKYFSEEQSELSLRHSRSIRNQKHQPGACLSSMSHSHSSLVFPSEDSCSFHILICTPGRLIDHLQFTEGFSLRNLKYLVLDEADRLLGNASDHWIRTLIKSLSSNSQLFNVIPNQTSSNISTVESVFSSNGYQRNYYSVQLLLFSATLTNNPKKLTMLGIKNPLIIKAATRSLNELANKKEKNDSDMQIDDEAIDDEEAEIGSGTAFTLPDTLIEQMCVTDAERKPLVLSSLLVERAVAHKLSIQNPSVSESGRGSMTLVFTSSVDTTHRLARLLQLINEQCGSAPSGFSEKLKFGGYVREMSRNISPEDRARVMAECAAGDVAVLVSSDQLARGIDLANIDLVVNYDAPKHSRTYVHRAGRTARANRPGTCITILKAGQVGVFNKMRSSIGGGKNPLTNSTVIRKYKISKEIVDDLDDIYSLSIKAVQRVLKDEEKGLLTSIQYIPFSLSTTSSK